MRATLLAVGATLAGFASSWTSAAEISGEVAQVRGEAITVAIDGSVKPSKGDEVQIIVDVPGVGEAEVGTATVTAVVDELVLAKIQSASGKIQAGQQVRISAGTTSDQKAESDLERLQGRWRNERSLLDGKPSEAFVGVEAILDGHNLTWAFTNRFSERHAQEGTFELDPTQTLKHFDLTYRTGTMPDQRIYALEGDTLRMGMAGKPRTRPNSFEGAKFQFELKRLPSADPATPPDASPEEIQQFQENLNAAENGDAQAQFRLGKMYFHGAGVVRDVSEAVRWFRLAADQGVAGATSELGFMYRFGLGVRQDETESTKLQQAAAEKGNPTDDEEAIRWFRKAAEGGYARAQWSFGNLYESGIEVPQDAKEAFRWYHEAARQKHPIGQYFVGKCCVEGKVVARDFEVGMQWLRLAAEQELPDAQNYIGWMYESGTGIPTNRTEAIRWYRKAADQGNRTAKENLRRLGVEP